MYSTLVAWLVAVTVTPGAAAPLWSVTRPVIEAAPVWAKAADHGPNTRTRTSANHALTSRMRRSASEGLQKIWNDPIPAPGGVNTFPGAAIIASPSNAMDNERLVSLDAFRGLTIAAMILVNNPGDWGHVYWPLEHAPWHGWTPTDLIFPFFLFMVGTAIPFSRRARAGEAARRALVIAALGLFMAAYPYFDLTTVRIPGVLVRIALCYLAVWATSRLGGPAVQAAIAAVLLTGYWYLMTRVPVPGGGPPTLDPETNLGAWLDRLLLDGHLWRQSRTWDPEGVLSTMPAIATTLLGLLAGGWLRSERSGNRKTAGLLAAGLLLVLLGLAWGTSFPINKNLWTSSYVLFTGGMAAYLFGLLYWTCDVRGRRTGAGRSWSTAATPSSCSWPPAWWRRRWP